MYGMKGLENHEASNVSCITTCVSRCEKGIYDLKTLSGKNGGKTKVMKNFIPSKYFDKKTISGGLSLKDRFIVEDKKLEKTQMFDNFPDEVFFPSDFLFSIETFISDDLISSENFSEIKKLAKQFNSNMTSFFGFESSLTSNNNRSDYLIAVSSQNGEREALLDLINNGKLSDEFLNKEEWRNVGIFTKIWADPKSILYNNILGLWLEFDTSDEFNEAPVPSIFLQTRPLRINNVEDIDKCKWVTRTAIPILTGKMISKDLENKFINALENLPEKASVFHVASMLSRNTEGMRLVIKRINPEDIVPYLISIGWSDEDNGLEDLLKELKNFSNCIRLHINISEKVDPEIGLECFISPDKYHKGQGWDEFFNHLVKKGICLPNMKSALLDFPGVSQEDPTNEFNFESYLPSVKLNDENFSKAIVRYISHVKVKYKPGNLTQAKAYTGVRLFGKQQQ
jgi:hypothetical protein